MDVREPKYSAGQLWRYSTPKGLEDTRLLVLKVEALDNEEVVHVTVVGGGDGMAEHMPFSTDAIDRSVVDLVDDTYPPRNFEEGYLIWRKLFESGKAGIYRVTLGEALEL